MIDAIMKELDTRKDYLEGDMIETIYFGGGTPSIVPPTQLQKLLNHIQFEFIVSDTCEITLEANPDDIDSPMLQNWVDSGINRLSLGVQSFHDDDLFFMNRAHSGSDALQAMSVINNSNIERITADIIFGYSGLTEEKLLYNLAQIYQSRIHHISCYAMTVEPKTALHHQIKIGKVKATDDQLSSAQFSLIKSTLQTKGFDHYEISNYARQDEYAIHNTHYWKNKAYLGVGPSAHSYNGKTREWNVANNSQYLKLIHDGQTVSEVELLSKADQYNEYIMTGLRTKWGVSLDKIKTFGPQFLAHFHAESKSLLKDLKLFEKASSIYISNDQLILCDSITSKLFFV